MRGCLIVGLVPIAALALLLSLAGTTEAEQPELFPGLRENRAPLVLVLLVVGVLATVAALALAVRGSRWVLISVGVMGVLLLGGAVCRTVTLAPMLHCSGHTAISREEDGSYRCADR
ncbi:hypothetical protein [Kitasatospora sp. P5_F3]